EYDDKAEATHRVDSLNLLIYVILLLITILTVWLFKQRRFRFIHETGLAIIYGLIIGAIIAYAIKKPEEKKGNDYFNSTNQSTVNPVSVFNVCSHQVETVTESSKNELQEKASIFFSHFFNFFFIYATFDPEVFFNVILPPIIFNAGYQMKKKHFFRNIGAITVIAFIGTTISTLVIGGLMYGFVLLIKSTKLTMFTDCLLFGAIISATDPVTVLAIFNDLNVDVDLYAIVFGESVLNDAVALTLTKSIESYKSAKSGFDGMAFLNCLAIFMKIFFGSLLFGCFMGGVTALLTKFTKLKNYPTLETSLFVLMSYATFLASECLDLTGIVALLFCGICQAHYTYNNLSATSQNNTRELFSLMNFLMENFVFTYIGVSTFTFQYHSWDAGLTIFAVFSVIVSRMCHIYPLSFLLNLGRVHKITCNMQHVMLFSGLRGALAFTLAIRNTSTVARQTILSITLIVIILTVFLLGGFTTQIIYWLKISIGLNINPDVMTNDYNFLRFYDGSSSGFLLEGRSSAASICDSIQIIPLFKRNFKKLFSFDLVFIKPLLTNHEPPLTETLPKCCFPIAKLLSSKEQLT
ncbi:hypothetical protein HELRODRAFT_119364, partial [Helobdella robusta]|uniref:Sodium/hydrogen exchanger n=1 Tax=Helobdella robusta TaxID=6412 RepID=T1EGN0_HELRO